MICVMIDDQSPMIHNGASLPGSAVPLDLACECNESGEKKEVIARWFNAVTEAGTPNYLTLTGTYRVAPANAWRVGG